MAFIHNVAEAEQLVKQLYSPASPQIIQRINEHLQQLQLSPDGWKLADELMGSDDPNVRFFAALTFTVKLNTDGSSLDEETSRSVLDRLIYWFAQQVQKQEGGLVSKKLCSTLATYFIRSSVAWRRPILHLARSFGSAKASVDDDEHPAAMEAVLPSLSPMHIKALLWFTAIFADEVAKMDANLPAHARSHKEMGASVNDASMLIKWSLSQFKQSDPLDVRAEALSAFLTWVNYSQPVWPGKTEALQSLRDLIGPAAECMLDAKLKVEALDIFRDMLESYTSFFRSDHIALIATLIHDPIQPDLARALAQRDSEESRPLGQLIIAFGCAYVQQVVEEPENQHISRPVIQSHLDILSAPGYPGDEDELSISSLEFWNTFVEFVTDSIYSQNDESSRPTWIENALAITQQLVELLWKKMWIPPTEVRDGWSEDESDAFKGFRLDACDLMLSIFVLRGTETLRQLVSYVLTSLQEKHWRAIEAAMLLLNALADNVLEIAAGSEIIEGIFRVSLFQEIADFSQAMPLQTRRTAIDLLGSYGQYIESHAEFLPDTLRFLFASLEVPSLANAAAKSIGSLCSACRSNLTGELDGFLAQYQRFLSTPTAESYTKEKVVGAIAAIIQAIPSDKDKARPLMALLEYVEKDINAAKELANAGDTETAESVGVTALECLASIGKGMQALEDVQINLYDDDVDQNPSQPSYWDSEEGQAIHQRIFGCFSALQVVGNSSAGIDAACQVLRSGLTESSPGPFVLAPSVVVSFLQQCSVHTPQLETVLSTAGMLIAQHSTRDSKRIDTDVAAIYGCILGFIQVLGSAGSDPIVAMGCLSVVTRLMPYYTHILLGSQVSDVLDFSLSAILSPDTLPKRSAAEFWIKLIKPSSSTALTPEVQQRTARVMEAYGPRLAGAIVHQIGGQAQRSELDSLCETLRALMMTQSGVQTWLQQSLTDAGFPGVNVGMADRERFMRQLLGVRSDGRRIKDLVRQFWAACRGTVVSY